LTNIKLRMKYRVYYIVYNLYTEYDIQFGIKIQFLDDIENDIRQQAEQMGRDMEKLAEENNGLKAQNNRSKGAYDCCICMEKTSDERKLAVLVPCGHTVCEECAPTMQGRACGICRRNSTYSVIVQGIY